MFSYVQTQKYSLEIILNSRFLFQDVAIMLFGAIACLVAVPVSIKCIIWQIRYINQKQKKAIKRLNYMVIRRWEFYI